MNTILRANLFLTLCTMIWGGTFIVLKVSLFSISPLIMVALRFSIAAVALFFIILSLKSKRELLFRSANSPVILHSFYLSLMMTAGFGLQTAGIQYITAGRSAFITELLILFTPFFQYMISRKLPGTGNYLGMLLILPGMYLLTSLGETGLSRGDVLTLLCAVGFALYITFLDHYSRMHDEMILLFWQLLFTSIFSFITAYFTEEPVFRIEMDSLFYLFYLSFAATLGALYLQTKFQKDTTPVQAGILYSLEPVFATVFAFFFLNERPDAFFYSGALLILLGVLISTGYERRKSA